MHVQVGEDELDQALTAAVTCCILAAAGPQRSRVLANLYKDERCARLPVFSFLEKVYLERILRHQEVTYLLKVHILPSAQGCCPQCTAVMYFRSIQRAPSNTTQHSKRRFQLFTLGKGLVEQQGRMDMRDSSRK